MTRPNIVLIVTDDHSANAMSCYGGVVNTTPHMDRIAGRGMRLDNCYCTNSICAPSRATILTGTHNHINGVTTLSADFDARQPTFVSALHAAGYQTALVGKWHLGHGGVHDPRDFDYWEVLPGQGAYHDPEFITEQGRHVRTGYATDIITDLSLDWLRARDPERPFCLLVHHKAPHRPWEPDEKHARMYDDIDLPVPENFDDDYAYRSTAAKVAEMRIKDHLNKTDLKQDPPEGLSDTEYASWAYQRYMKDYLRCVASVDDNIGRLLDELDSAGLSDDTIVAYTSDQGFFLGEHGWYDKRFMYEESLQMPLLVSYPREIPAASTSDAMVMNLDFAQTFLDYAGVDAPERMQGRSMRDVLRGRTPDDWREEVYYRYWEHDSNPHHVWAHYGIRTRRYKLIRYYSDGLGQSGASDRVFPPEWELFDLDSDAKEMHSVYDDPQYAQVRERMQTRLWQLQAEIGDKPHPVDE